MENKTSTSKFKKNDLHFLPNFYKKIGLIIMVLPFAIIISIKLFNPAFLHSHKESILTYLPNICILGLLLFALARDKFEDEMTLLLRLKAIAWTFFVGVFSVITQPLFDRMWGDPIKVLSSQHLIVIMLISYITFFFIMKKFR